MSKNVAIEIKHCCDIYFFDINPMNAKLNPICHLLALLGAQHILHVSGVRVNCAFIVYNKIN
jgi:hypothetical protein